MAFKRDGVTVIDNSGNIDWARIKKNFTLSKEADNVTTTGAGSYFTETMTGRTFKASSFQNNVTKNYYNCANCNCDCDCRC